MRLSYLVALAATLIVGGTAGAQCPGGCPADGPVRRAMKARPHLFPIFHRAKAPAMPAMAAPPVAVPKVAAAAPVVGKPGDRVKEKLLAEIRDLHAKEAAGKLTPDQWERLLALIELFVRLFVH